MFPEKIEFDGIKYRTKSYNKVLECLTLSISKPMSYEETKKKKEKDFRLSPIQYPEPVHYRKIKRKQKNLKVLIINIL